MTVECPLPVFARRTFILLEMARVNSPYLRLKSPAVTVYGNQIILQCNNSSRKHLYSSIGHILLVVPNELLLLSVHLIRIFGFITRIPLTISNHLQLKISRRGKLTRNASSEERDSAQKALTRAEQAL